MNTDDIKPVLTDRQLMDFGIPDIETGRAIELAALKAAPVAAQAPQDERMETTSEHIARDIREGRFPQRSEPQRVRATEWGPMPDAGVEADAHVAVIEGDEAVRVLRWNSDVGAFSYPVGTRLYAAQAPAADGDALDAARYRLLRKGAVDDVAVVRGLGAMDYGMSAVVSTYSEEIDGDDLDAAIDAARSTPATEKGE